MSLRRLPCLLVRLRLRQMTLPTMVPTSERATRTLMVMMTGTAYSFVARVGAFHPAGTAMEVWLASAAWLLAALADRLAVAAAVDEVTVAVNRPRLS